MKEQVHDRPHTPQRLAAANPASMVRGAAASRWDQHVDCSPRQAAQRLSLGAAFGPSVIQKYPSMVGEAIQPDIQRGVRDRDGVYQVSAGRMRPHEVRNDSAETMQYVVTPSGEMWVGTRGAGFPHPCLIGGFNPQVAAAGEIKFHNGQPYAMNTKSGHFQPPAGSIALAVRALAAYFPLPIYPMQTGDHDFNIATLPAPELAPSFFAPFDEIGLGRRATEGYLSQVGERFGGAQQDAYMGEDDESTGEEESGAASISDDEDFDEVMRRVEQMRRDRAGQ